MKPIVALRKRLLVAGLAGIALLACSGGDESTPPQTSPQAAPASIPGATADSTPESTQVTIEAADDLAVSTSQSPWAQDRIRALTEIWDYSPEGLIWLQTYDFRQMEAQPTWFGSTGFKGWAGAGQAIPRTIMHEMSHSFWGVFGVDGSPGLEWTSPIAGRPSEGIAMYRADLERFMAQPPDRFEPLRDRFRNLPNLTLEEDSDLYHFGEADLIFMTGGDIDLIPPILRPYYTAFLTDSAIGGLDFDTWPEALRWFQSLSEDDRVLAGEVFGLQHFPLDRYKSLGEGNGGRLPAGLEAVLAAEERQRLRDFAEQFESIKEREFALVDAAGIDSGFQFWRGYIGEMSDLHTSHPNVLAEAGTSLGGELAETFDFYRAIAEKSADEQITMTLAEFSRPVIRDLAVLLSPRALIALFSDDRTGPGAGLGDVLTGYADALRRIAKTADAFIDAARSDPAEAAAIFDRFVANPDDDELRTTVPVLVDFLRASEQDLLSKSMPLASDSTLLRLLEIRPELARAPEVTPERLLAALGITPGREPEAGGDVIAAGARRLFENGSGNFEIDRPVVAALYDLLDDLETELPGFTLGVVRDASLGLTTWINASPENALRAIRNDEPLAARLIATRESVRSTPAGVVHRIIAEDPFLAADLLVEIDTIRGVPLSPLVLAAMVYDGYWSELAAGPEVSLSNDALFLSRLADINGEQWLIDALDVSVAAYTTAIEAGRIENEYPERHARTLEAIEEAAGSEETKLLIQKLSARLNQMSLD